MDAMRPTSDSVGTPTLAQGTPASPDLVKILLRWKWLPILGSAIGATLGYLYWVQIAPTYRATAQVQVVAPPKEIPISTFDNKNDGRSRGDELVIVRSSAVLRQAVDIGQLTQNQKGMLAGRSADDIVKMLRNPYSKMMEVRLGSKDVNSDIVDINITTDKAELSVEIVQAIVIGYEHHMNEKVKSYSKEAIDVLTRFSDTYNKNKDAAKSVLDELQKNKDKELDLIWVDGKPRSPASDKIVKCMDAISEIDVKMKNIDAVIQQIEKGRDANRPLEELLRMALNSTYDSGFKQGEGNDVYRERDIARNMQAQIEQFESDRVIPFRSELDRLRDQDLGDSHPSVISAKTRSDRLEEELARRKAELKRVEMAFEKENGTSRKESFSVESRLTVAYGALKETLSKLQFESNEFRKEAAELREKASIHQGLISNYAINLADLEASKAVADQIGESLRKLELGSDFAGKSITRLEFPTSASFAGPYWTRYLGIGALLGFVAFSGLAYLLEIADRSYRNPDEIAGDLGMPIIGHLPLAALSRSDRIDEKVDSSIVTLHKNRSSLAEAFRGIRTAVFFGCQQGNIKVIQVTSPVPGDGKSTVAGNLAVSIAQSGRRVCLVDCDFRRPRVAKIFGLKEEVGLVQVIGGKVELEDAIQQTSIENLFSVTCGRRPGNPSELLSSERFADSLTSLREQFDFVIVDTPPMLVVSDPANVAGLVDAVLLTVRLRRNLKPIATRAAQMLHSINANMLGVVVNGIGVGGNSYGYGGYRYDNYSGGSSSGYGKSGHGGYGYGSTYQYGGYYGGTMIGRDYYDDQVPKPIAKKNKVNS